MSVFIVMALSGLSLNVFGQIYLTELILIIYIFITWLSGKKDRNIPSASFFRPYFFFIFLALAGQVISDVSRSSPMISFFKGFSLLLFTFMNLSALIQLTQLKVRKFNIAVLGWATGLIIGALFQRPDFITTQSLLWKFGFGYPLTLIFFAYVSFKRRKIITILITSLMLTTIHLLNDSRSLALFTLFSSIYILFFSKRKFQTESIIPSKNQTSRIVLIVSIFILVSFGTISYLQNLDQNNKVAQKFQEQSQSGFAFEPLSVLISARAEVIPEFIAIKNSPIIGYGSYPLNTDQIKSETNNFLTVQESRYLQKRLSVNEQNLIPTHSSIFQNWVWFGILGVPFFLLLLRHILFALIRFQANPVIVFLLIHSFWDILFSPYAGLRRIQYPLVIVALAITLKNLSKEIINTQSKPVS